MSEVAATREPGGPQNPPDTGWLILQRMDDLRRAQDDLRADMKDLRADMKDMRAEVKAEMQDMRAEVISRTDSLRSDLERKIESVRNWSLGLLLLAILGVLAKLLIPSA